MSKKEKEIYRKSMMKYLCPICENKSISKIILENMQSIPMLVKDKCQKCGYVGMLVEIPLNKRELVK